MTLIQETQGLETFLGMACVVLSVIGMMAVGMIMDAFFVLKRILRLSLLLLFRVCIAVCLKKSKNKAT